jgi:hypothetical protein
VSIIGVTATWRLMMKTQVFHPAPTAAQAQRRVLCGQVERVAGGPGELTVVDGRVWVTRRGDRDDHVLGAGQRITLSRADAALLEAWDAQAGATVCWQPAPRAGLAAAARRLASGLRRLTPAWAATVARVRPHNCWPQPRCEP